jgi:hypothetical protein
VVVVTTKESEQPPSGPNPGGEKYTRAKIWSAFQSIVRENFSRVLIGYALVLFVLLSVAFVLGVSLETPVDDGEGLIKEIDDVAAECVVTLDSFDPDLQQIKASVEVGSPVAFQRDADAVKKLALADDAAFHQIHFGYGDLSVRDATLEFNLYGTRLDTLDLGIFPAAIKTESLKAKPPDAIKNVELTAEGSPRLYPFDSYIVVGRIDIPIRMISNEKSVDIIWKNYRVNSRLAGFLVEAIGVRELKGEAPKHIAESADEKKFEDGAIQRAQNWYGLSPQDAWIASRFVLKIHRPLILKILAILLIITATSFSFWIAFKTEPKAYVSNAAGYLVAMWAAKSILGGQAPKTPSLLDYIIVLLFFFQIVVIAMRAATAHWGKHFGNGEPPFLYPGSE